MTILKILANGHVWSWPVMTILEILANGHVWSWPSWRYWRTVMTGGFSPNGHDWSWPVMTTHNRYWKTRFFSIPFFCLWPVMTAHGMQKNITYSKNELKWAYHRNFWAKFWWIGVHKGIQYFTGFLVSSWSIQISFFMLLRQKTTNSISAASRIT